MNADIKRRWIEALRSGEFVQNTDGYLRHIDEEGNVSWCGLGVLCHVVDPESDKFITGKAEVLPTTIQLVAGLASNNPELLTDYGRSEIAEINDFKSYDFHQLAALIEEQL